MAQPTPKAATAAAGTGKSRKKLLLVLGVVLVLLGGGGGAGAWYLTRGGGGHAEKEDAARAPLFFALDPFTVNLQDETDEQYLQVGLTLKVDDEAQIDLLKLHMPELRSRLLMLLSSKKASEILTPEGKRTLSEEIIAQVREPFRANSPPQAVSGVFFTSFVVQ